MDLPDHRIEFITHQDPNRPERRVLIPYIDGRDLREVVRPGDSDPSEAGHPHLYGGIPLTQGQSLRRHYLGDSVQESYSTTITVLGCRCGIVECGPLRVEITVSPHLVTWHRFPQLVGSPDGGRLGPFRFDRWEYESGLEHVRSSLEDNRASG